MKLQFKHQKFQADAAKAVVGEILALPIPGPKRHSRAIAYITRDGREPSREEQAAFAVVNATGPEEPPMTEMAIGPSPWAPGSFGLGWSPGEQSWTRKDPFGSSGSIW